MGEKSKRATVWIWIILAVAVVGGFLLLIVKPSGPNNLGPFAQCLKDKGAVFYGAFWCPHCQNQKTMFGNAKDILPYIECSTPDGQSQTSICTQKGIKNYPTWEFKDGSRLTGEVSLQQLASKTGCELPK